jgi:uncharacterized Tic20 family protein
MSLINVEFNMPTNPSREECLMASVAHASVVIIGPGIIVGVLIWITQKEKSTYASGQGLQATLYQLLGMIIIMYLWTIWSILYALTWIPWLMNPEQFDNAPPPIFWIGMASMVVPLIFMLVWVLYGLWGALKTLLGSDFRYLLIGNILT